MKLLHLAIAPLTLLSVAHAFARSSANVNYDASTFAGADASIKINACLTAVIAAGGGTCDAVGLGGSQHMSQQVNVGSAASAASSIGVTLLLPDVAAWEWSLSDPASCGLYQYSGTAVLGNQPGGGGNRMVLSAKHGSTMDAIYCTPATGDHFVRAEGFSVWNNAPSTFTNGVVHIRNVVDESSFSRIFAENYYGDVFHVESACCGTRFVGIHAISNGSISNGSAGGTPLTIGPGKVSAVGFYDSSANRPGYGSHHITFTGGSSVMGVSFYNLYMEGNGAIDGTTSMVYVAPAIGPVHFFGGLGNTEQATLSRTKAVFENHGYLLDVSGFEAINTKLGIADFTVNKQVAVWNYSGNLGDIPRYATSH